jgi:hypothetical protein
MNQNSNLNLLNYDSDKSYPIQISSEKQNTNINDKTKQSFISENFLIKGD